MKRIFIDIETTGVDPMKHGITQIAAIIPAEGDREERVFTSNVRPFPTDLIDDEALKVTGVSKEDMDSYPLPDEVHKKFKAFMSNFVNPYDRLDKFAFCGYNCQTFDYPFLRKWFEKCGDKYFGSWFWWPTIDIAIKAMDVVKDRHTYPNFKLTTVCQKVGMEWDEHLAHEALYDIRKTMELYFNIKQMEL